MNPTLAPWLGQQLQQLAAHQGHALLLTGPSGLGQYELALALTRFWLCDQPDTTTGAACGQCTSCHAIDVRTHADLKVVMPETLAIELDWPLDERTRDKIEKKEIKASKWIRVDTAREVVSFAQTTRSRGRCKVVLVYPADRLNTESANALLKTLEEPSGDLRFVLATEAAHALPATIRSRCQLHAMHWPSQAEGLAWLAQMVPHSTPAQQQVWWQASGGRPQDALIWAQHQLSHDTWHGLPKSVLSGVGQGMHDWPPALQLDVLQKIAHDAMATQTQGEPRFFNASDLPHINNPHALQNWAHQLMQAARTVEHPFNANWMLQAWLTQAKQVAQSPKTA